MIEEILTVEGYTNWYGQQWAYVDGQNKIVGQIHHTRQWIRECIQRMHRGKDTIKEARRNGPVVTHLANLVVAGALATLPVHIA